MRDATRWNVPAVGERRKRGPQLGLVRLTVLSILLVLGTSTRLSSAQPDERTAREQKLVFKAQELGHSKQLSNTQKLIRLSKDPSEVVRVAAAQNLGELLAGYGDPGNAVTSGGENFPEIAEGAAQLAKRVTLSPFEVVGFRSALITETNDASAPVRVAAIDALRSIFASDNPKIAPRPVKEAIAPHVKDADTRVVRSAMSAAYFLHMRESRGDLLANLDHQDAGVRDGAAQALALMGVVEAAEPISRLLKDREPDVRKSAARRLVLLCRAAHCDPGIGAALLEALPEKSLRSDIARTIAILNIPEGKQPLILAFQTDMEQDASWLGEFSEIDLKELATYSVLLGRWRARPFRSRVAGS